MRPLVSKKNVVQLNKSIFSYKPITRLYARNSKFRLYYILYLKIKYNNILYFKTNSGYPAAQLTLRALPYQSIKYKNQVFLFYLYDW